MRQSVGERGPVVEDVLRSLSATLDAGPEGVVDGPIVEDLAFQCREIRRTRGVFWVTMLGHGRAVSCAVRARGRRRAVCANAAVPPRLRTRARVRRSFQAVTGLCPSGSTEPLPEQAGRSSGGSPVMAGSMPMTSILTASSRAPKCATHAAHRSSPRRSPTIGRWLDNAFRQRQPRTPGARTLTAGVSSDGSAGSSCAGRGWSSRLG